MIEMGKWLFETGPTWYWPMHRLNHTIHLRQGEQAILDCLANGQGVLIATPHLGNWELAGLAGSQIFPLTIMYRPPRISTLDKPMRDARTRAGARLAAINQQGLRQIITALKRGEAVGLLPDQEPKEETSAVFAPFFGINARTMTLFQKLARKTQAAVFFATMKRLPYGRGYDLEFRRARNTVIDEDEIVSATALNQELEQIIMGCPEQYLWSYRRFKFRPPGEPPVYPN